MQTDYSKLTDRELIALLSTKGERLTRAAVDEFLARGARMVASFTRIVLKRKSWE